MIHPRLLNQLFENENFKIDKPSLGYVVRDIINMNWWNTAGILVGYSKNRRINAPFTNTQKLIAVQLKEFYRQRRIILKDEDAFRDEIKNYVSGKGLVLRQHGMFSMRARANPSQYFHKKVLSDGVERWEMTWVDCTSRATYAAKYVFQNGYIDFDGACRLEGCNTVREFIEKGICEDLGIRELFIEGECEVKKECFSQEKYQMTVLEWVNQLGIKPIKNRDWLLGEIGHVRTDPFKNFEKFLLTFDVLKGNNELLYGFKTMASVGVESDAGEESEASRASNASNASAASDASDASRASNASAASDASYASSASTASAASRASDASYASIASNAIRASNASDASAASSASRASNASRASDASHASAASDAGTTGFKGRAWQDCETAITKPNHLEYPAEFRANIFAIAGNWKIDKNITSLCKKAWFDPFSGHGTSPLYAKRNGINYLGFDTNVRAFNEYLNIINEELAKVEGASVKVELHDSTIFRSDLVGQFDLCYTSPPYFNFEEYGGNTGHYMGCDSYSDFHNKISIPVLLNVAKYLVEDGILAWQVEKQASCVKLWREVILSTNCFELLSEGLTGQEKIKYSKMSKRDQSLLVFRKKARHNADKNEKWN